MQVANVFACRSGTRSAFAFGLLDNKLLLGGVAVELLLILAIAYAAPGNQVFGTAPIGPEVWLFVLPFALLLLLLEETRKAVRRRCYGDSAASG